MFGKALFERLRKLERNRQALKVQLVTVRWHCTIVLAVERNKYVTNRRHGSVLSFRLADQSDIVGVRREWPSSRKFSPTDSHKALPWGIVPMQREDDFTLL